MRWIAPLAVVFAFTRAASADGFYYTEGLGGTKVSDELAAYIHSGVRIRIAIGMRHERWALEGFLSGDINADLGGDLGRPSAQRYSKTADLMSYGVDVKYLNPICPHLEVYLRGSLSAAQADGPLIGYAGRGLGFGAGVQLKGKVRALGFLAWPFFFMNLGPKVTAALWIDDGYDFYRLHGSGPTAIDGQVTRLTIGFAVGSDF